MLIQPLKKSSWHRARHIDQKNGIEILEVNSYIYGQLIFDMSTKSIQWGKNILFNRGSGTIGFPHVKK